MSATASAIGAKGSTKYAIVATAIMVASFAAAWWLTPTRYWYDEEGRPDLEQVIPRQFGEWTASDRAPVELINPELSETLRTIYTQTLSRLYLNRSSGRTIMLSVALGRDQARATQLHHPEGCYRTQGFVVEDIRNDVLNSPAGMIKLTRFASHAHARNEPVSYWIRIGKWNVGNWFDRNLSRLALVGSGYIADGLLFRVSEVSGDPVSSYRLQDQFMNDLITSVPVNQRAFLIGSVSS